MEHSDLIFLRKYILVLTERGETNRSICKQTGYSIRGIQKIREKWKIHGTIQDLDRSGRPKAITPRTLRHLIISAKQGELSSIPKAKSTYSNSGIKTGSVKTLRRNLHQRGYFGRLRARKPHLTVRQRRARLAFAKKYQSWTTQDWEKVIFEDEKKFCVFGPNRGKQWCWRVSGNRLLPQLVNQSKQQKGGGFMVSGFLTANGIGYFVRGGDDQSSIGYVQILEDELKNTIEYYDMPS